MPYHQITPILLDGDFRHYMEQINEECRRNNGASIIERIVNCFLSLSCNTKPPAPIVFDLDGYRRNIIRRIAERSREAVIKQWEDCGIDQPTAEYYMDYFSLQNNLGEKNDLIIPSDSAMVFLWLRYQEYCWGEIGEDFGIYTYIWLYGFFFPHLIFEIPSYRKISRKDRNFLYDNYEQFENGMTMGRVVELILLYKNEKRMNSTFFEPDIAWGSIGCNLEWKQKLMRTRISLGADSAND